jgi:MICOS complex subunit MIC12
LSYGFLSIFEHFSRLTMGFTGGFVGTHKYALRRIQLANVLFYQVGGVTLTLSLAYLAVLTHQRNRQAQGDLLRSQAQILTTLTRDSPIPSNFPPPQPTRVELAVKERDHLVATFKDKWNAEIQKAVRWAQTKDWAETREAAEERVRQLSGLPPIQKAAQELEAEVARAEDAAKSAASRASTAAKSAASSATTTAKSALQESKASAAKAAGETKEAAKGMFARGLEKGKELVGRTKASVKLAEERMETKLDHAFLESDVDRALSRRYKEGESDALKQSVEEALNERYAPISERDIAKLRGL